MIMEILLNNTGHFAINVFGAFVFFSCGWLYFDSSKVNKKIRTPVIRSIGFFMLALVWIIHATSIELNWLEAIWITLKSIGLLLILISLVLEPIMDKPEVKKMSMVAFLPTTIMFFGSPITSVLISLVYWLKSTKGLEKQLRLAAWGFTCLTISEIIGTSSYWSSTNNVFWSKILESFGLVWNIHHGFELMGMIILVVWVWGYINFRHHLQLFIYSIASTLVIFVLTTLFFCFLLLKNLENNTLTTISTDANVLEYLMDRLGDETMTNARELVNRDSFKTAFLKKDQTQLYKVATDFMLSQNISSVLVASASGEVVIRTDNKEKFGDNVMGNQLISNAVLGRQLATVSIDKQANFSSVMIDAAVPIFQKDQVVGAVIVSLPIDNAFVDGVKKVTGLDVTIYGNDIRSATTLIGADGVSRSLGTKETDSIIVTKVLKNGQKYVGQSQVLNQPYYSAYLPIKDFTSQTVGMLYVGKVQTALLEVANKSIQLTFLGSAVLIILSIYPTYLLSEYIKDQMEA